MSSEEILRDIKAKRFSPVYFLHGEEPFFIDQVADAVEASALPEAERGFNQTVLYGKEMDHITLLDYLRRYPMMSERQVVILREAQEMKGLTELTAYMENPMPSTVFVVCHKHKKVDSRTKFGKSLQGKSIVLLESKKLYDNQIADWISSFCKTNHLHIDSQAAALMAEYLGADLSRIANELDKLTLNLPKGATITAAHVQEFVGISKDYNLFELQKALAMRDVSKVARIQHYFASNMRKNPLIVTISSLYSYFSKVYMLHGLKGSADADILKALDLRSDWFLKEYRLAANHYNPNQTVAIISLLKDYDLRSKGVNNDNTSTGEEELMKELFWRILHA
ncbi:MAG TPA: DNA polymerase III subunit delta [Saprospiraceae bacterium]|nr:DNA polymerase III subunit delta [Saprospiraceae bacterium]HPI06077.1 DNA polymerase III subunit delta [Saprospiraceae bacterium]